MENFNDRVRLTGVTLYRMPYSEIFQLNIVVVVPQWYQNTAKFDVDNFRWTLHITQLCTLHDRSVEMIVWKA